MNFVDVAEAARQNQFKWALLPFYKDNKAFQGHNVGGGDCSQDQKSAAMPKGFANTKLARPLWGMTLLAAGSMRFRWNETNPNRDKFLSALCGDKRIVPLELIHSKIVYDAREAGDTFQKQGDAIITQNAALVPVVTVADCVPIYFYDSVTGAFGAAHSGWKGTGIAGDVVKMMKEKYGSNPRDILAAVGPHIHDCCYTVDAGRAKYFCDNFGSGCVREVSQGQDWGGPGLFGQKQNFSQDKKYALSLLRANLNVLAAAGVLEENVVAATNCTSCDARFGSFRREAVGLPDIPGQDKSRLFTTQAAFVIIEERES